MGRSASFIGSNRQLRKGSASEVLADSVSSYFFTKCRYYNVFVTILQAILVFGVFLLLLLAVHYFFPDTTDLIRSLASWTSDFGAYGVALFAFLAGLIMLIPGVPGSLLCFTCGAVFPFWTGLFVAIVGHHLGAVFGFLLSRWCLYNYFTDVMKSKPKLMAMSRAAELEQWKVTFLSRFVFMPVQLKNYLFGVLPVSFKCFFLMALIGDFQSGLFGVYLGSLSTNILDKTTQVESGDLVVENQGNEKSSNIENILSIVSVVVAIAMTTIASIVARRAYLKVLNDLEADLGEDFEQVQMIEKTDFTRSRLHSEPMTMIHKDIKKELDSRFGQSKRKQSYLSQSPV